MPKLDFKKIHERAKKIHKKGYEKYCDAVKRAYNQLEMEKKK